MCLYRALFAFDALVLLVLAYFFLDGLQYVGSGGVPWFWLPLLAGPAAVMAGAWLAHASGRPRLATALLLVLALPPALYAVFLGLLLATNPSFH